MVVFHGIEKANDFCTDFYENFKNFITLQWLLDLHSKVTLQNDEPVPVMLLANKVSNISYLEKRYVYASTIAYFSHDLY